MNDINISIENIEKMPFIGKITLYHLDDYFQKKSNDVCGTVFSELKNDKIQFYVELNQYQHDKISIYNNDTIGGYITTNNDMFMILNEITKESIAKRKQIDKNIYTFLDVATIYGIPNVNKNKIDVTYVTSEDKGTKSLFRMFWNISTEQYNMWIACKNKVVVSRLLNEKNDSDLMTKAVIHQIKRARI